MTRDGITAKFEKNATVTCRDLPTVEQADIIRILEETTLKSNNASCAVLAFLENWRITRPVHFL